MEKVNEITAYILIAICFVGGLIFTLWFKAYNLNAKRIYKTLKSSNKKTKKGISGFQALMLSTASRIGNGNIAGVSSAIMVGGPGALFWMWITAFLGMSTAFAEGALAQLYKQKWGDTYVGGTPFYIAKRSGKRFLKIIATIYAVFAIFTFGSSYIGVQSNTIASNFNGVINTDSWVVKLSMGIFLALIIFVVTIKGIKSIGKFTEFAMPTMGILYLIVALIIIFMNIEKTGEVYNLIFQGAFGTKQIIGGVGGYTVIKAIQLGVKRGVFSNEAGIGSASFSAASSDSKHPVQQGLLQSLSTFLDTIIICSASGFIILYTGVWEGKGKDYNTGLLIKDSIAKNLGGKPAEWLVFIALFLFGITTSIGLYFYSETALRYIMKKQDKVTYIHKNSDTGKSSMSSIKRIFHNTKVFIFKPKVYTSILKVLVCGFVIYSAVEKVDFIWDMEGISTFILVAINVPFMLTQVKAIKNLIVDYKKQVASKKEIHFEYDCDKSIIS